jgi:hypothetical protein
MVLNSLLWAPHHLFACASQMQRALTRHKARAGARLMSQLYVDATNCKGLLRKPALIAAMLADISPLRTPAARSGRSRSIYGMLALFTLALHVAAIRLWVQGWRTLGIVCGAAGFLAFVMTAFASLGGLAARGDAVVAERQDALDSKADVRGQIKRLEGEREKLAFTRTTKAGVDAAKLKASTARAAKEAECSPIRGRYCRGKEDAEIEAAGDVTKAEANKAATDRADQIDERVRGGQFRVGCRGRRRQQSHAEHYC